AVPHRPGGRAGAAGPGRGAGRVVVQPGPGGSVGQGRPGPLRAAGHHLAEGGSEVAGMRLNWFTGDVAEYTRVVLPLLRQQAEVTLWTTRPHASPALAGGPVRHFRPEEVPWDEVNRADATVYLLDAVTAALGRQHPGIVVLQQDAAVERA